jgi:hypothetical protein
MKPTLNFFRAWPENLGQLPPLASSLQSLETCFLLLSYVRYPHALVSCATAIESAIRAKLGLASEDRSKFSELLDVIQNHPHNIKALSQKSLDELRESRNRIVHYGFSPQDDDISIRLLIQTALPLLSRLYQSFFDLYLDWRDVRPGVESFHDLTPDEMAKVGLIPDFADSLHLVRRIFTKAKELRGVDLSYCIIPFAHHVRFACKANFLGLGEESLLQDGDGETYEAVNAAKERWRKAFYESDGSACFDLDCPTCRSCETVVAQIDESQLDRGEVIFQRAACAQCGLVLPNKPFLANMVLRDEISTKSSAILKDYGLEISR